jgi:excisionase family DNA binding protein
MTPAEVATILFVSHDKVLGWIRGGELHAVNVANRGSRKPHYRIMASDFENFLRLRSSVDQPPEPPKRSTRRRRSAPAQSGDVVEFFR